MIYLHLLENKEEGILVETAMKTGTKKKDLTYVIKSVVGIALMAFVRFIPAPAPLTQAGMALIGIFLGLLFCWTFVDMIWPTFAALILFAPIAMDIFPTSTALTGLYQGITISFGDWIPFLVLMMMFYIDVLIDCGLVRRISLWFITRKIAQKNPWNFTLMFFLATFVLGLFLDVSPLQIMMFAIAKEVFDIAKMDENDKYVHVVATGITFTVMIAFCATPFAHSITVALMGIFSGIASGVLGTPVGINWISYMGVSLPVCILVWICLMLFMRFGARPDVSKLKDMDYTKIDALRPGPMTGKEKLVTIVSVVLIVLWILPGILTVIAPNAAITVLFDKSLNMLATTVIALVLFAVIRIDGAPVLDMAKAAKNTQWALVFFLCGISLIANSLGESTTGITAFLAEILSPVLSGLSPFWFVAILGIMACICTNFANNLVVGILFLSIGVPLSVQMGINPTVTGVAISLGCALAFALPSAFVPIAYCFAHPLGGSKYTFKYGCITMLISCIFLLLVYPLGSIIF